MRNPGSVLSRTVVAPLSSAIIALMLAGIFVVGVDQVGETVQIGTARLVPDGTVELALDGGQFKPTEGGNEVLDRDDRVKVTSGKAVLELPLGVRVELREGSTVALADGDATHLRLETGDLLVESRGEEITVDGGLASMTVRGVAKLRRAVSLVAGVYEGQVKLTKDESTLIVPRYRQAAAAGTGILPRQAAPLRLDPSDPWDERILPKVLDLDAKLVALGRQFESSLPAGLSVGPELFRQVVPDLTSDPITDHLLLGRAPGENLIGLVLLAQDQGSFADRVRNVFGFRADGASWGLVAAERELNTNPILSGMESALGALNASQAPVASETPRGEGPNSGGTGRGSDPVGAPQRGGTPSGSATPPATKPSPGPTTTPPSGSNPGAGTTNPPPSGEPPPSGDPQPNPPPSTPPPPPPKLIDLPQTGVPVLDGLLDPLVDPLESLLSGVLDGLLGLTPRSTTPAPATSTGLLGGLLGG